MTVNSQTVSNNMYGMNPDFNVAAESSPKGLVQIVTNGLSVPYYDYVSVAYPLTTTEVYTFKVGGTGGTTVATVTIVYTDATKENLSTVTRT